MTRYLCVVSALLLLATPAVAQQLAQGPLTASGQSVCVDATPLLSNTPTLNIQISNTYAGTITFQGRVNTPTATAVSILGSNLTSGTTSATTTSTGIFAFSNTGFQTLCATMTSYTSGTADVIIYGGKAGGGGGAGGGGAAGAVTVADGANVVEGSTTDAGASGVATINAHLRFIASTGIPITGTVTTTLPAAAALADNTANPTVPGVGAFLMCWDTTGVNWDRCPTSTGGAGATDSNTGRVVVANDDPVSVALAKVNTQLVAHAAADAGNPLKIGLHATTSISAQTLVTNNQRTDWYGDADGVGIVRLYANLADRVSTTPILVTDGSSTSLVAAQGAGIRFCATDITITNSSATNVTVDIRDGTAGAVLWTFPAAANMGGTTHHFGTPLCTTANTAMATDPSAAATTITTSVLGFKTKL
jgi:hypothetical protein